MQACRACVAAVVKSFGIEPEAIDGATEVVALERGEETTVLVVVFPFSRWVDAFPFFGHFAHFDDLFEKRE